MGLFSRRKPTPDSTPDAPQPLTFGKWALRKFANGSDPEAMSFHEVERVCSNAGSVVCTAAYEHPEVLGGAEVLSPELIAEAKLIAERTGDSFKAMIDDPDNTVVAWPWDHLATRVAWQTSQQGTGTADEELLGSALHQISLAYAVAFREQLGHVLDFWGQVVGGLDTPTAERPNLKAMSNTMFDAYRRDAATTA